MGLVREEHVGEDVLEGELRAHDEAMLSSTQASTFGPCSAVPA